MREHAIQLGYDFGWYDVVPGLEAVHVAHERERQEASLLHKQFLQTKKLTSAISEG